MWSQWRHRVLTRFFSSDRVCLSVPVTRFSVARNPGSYNSHCNFKKCTPHRNPLARRSPDRIVAIGQRKLHCGHHSCGSYPMPLSKQHRPIGRSHGVMGEYGSSSSSSRSSGCRCTRAVVAVVAVRPEVRDGEANWAQRWLVLCGRHMYCFATKGCQMKGVS